MWHHQQLLKLHSCIRSNWNSQVLTLEDTLCVMEQHATDHITYLVRPCGHTRYAVLPTTTKKRRLWTNSPEGKRQRMSCAVPCLSSKVAQCMWMLGLWVRWTSQARLKTARASSTLCNSRYWVYWTTHDTCYINIRHHTHTHFSF